MREVVFPSMVFLSAELSTVDYKENDTNTRSLANYLKDQGEVYGRFLGVYKNSQEKSFGVLVEDEEHIKRLLDLAKVFNQESILVLDKSRNGELRYSSGQVEKIGSLKYISRKEALVSENYTKCLNTGNYFTFKV